MVSFKALTIAGLGLAATCAHATLAFVPDMWLGAVFKFDAETGEYKGIIGSGFVGQPRSVEQNPNDSRLYVSCYNSGTGYIVRLNPYTGEYLGQVGTGILQNPDDIAFGSDGTMYVTDYSGSGWVILKFDPITGEYKGLIANGFIGGSGIGASLVSSGDDLYVMGAGATAIQKFNGITGEYLGVIGSGFFESGRGLALTTIDGEETLLAGQQNSTGSVFKFRTSDAAYQGMIAGGGFVPLVRATAVLPNGWVIVRGYSSGTEYIARFVPETGEYKGLFAANWNLSGIGLAVEAKATISGTVVFEDYEGTGVNRPVTFEVYDGANLLDTVNAVLVPNAGSPTAYSIQTSAHGSNLTLKARGSRWLKQAVSGVDTSAGPISGVNYSLINGDVDQDGEITLSDIDIVIGQYGTGFPDTSPEDADVNGTLEVELTDIDIVIANYGLGDE